MGLDLALGALVLIWAIRGWMKGFVAQAVGLASLVGAIFAAAPVRTLVRPHVQPYLPSIQPVILDRLLWWSSAVVLLALLCGVGTWLVRLSKKKTYGPVQPNRTDQGAGFVLGTLKGVVVAAFVVAGYERYIPAEFQQSHIVDEQTKNSRALAWSLEHHPAEKIWNAPPVRMMVAEVRRHGLDGGEPQAPVEEAADPAASQSIPAAATETAKTDAVGGAIRAEAEDPPADPQQTAQSQRTTPRLTIPMQPRIVGPASRTIEQIDRELRELGLRTPDSR